MNPPHGANWCKPGQALLLRKAIYGTKQAGRCFYRWIKSILTADGWVQSASDPSMFTWSDADTGLCIGVIYVDDGIIASPGALVERLFSSLASLPSST